MMRKMHGEKIIRGWQILFFVAPFFYGLYYEHLAVLAGMVFLVLLWLYQKKRGLSIYVNPISIGMTIVFLGYFLSIFYAVDSGMAWLGFLKKLPIFIFLLLIMQLSREEQTCLLEIIPFAGTAMTLIGMAAYIIPSGKEFFYMAGRLSGCFQYANTYAMFLLCGIIIRGWSEKQGIKNYVILFLLMTGIFLTGSRTVFLLLIPAIVILIIKNKGLRIIIIPAALLASLGAAYAYMIGNLQNIGRFLTISLHSSTFQGRLLYLYDALSMLFHHPFGLGCQGYSYLQSEVQTGLYSVQYVHNGFLQIGLDAGIIPMLVCLIMILFVFFSGETTRMQKVLLVFLSLHSLIDFDMEYLFMEMLALLCMNVSGGKSVNVKHVKQFTLLRILCNFLMAVIGILFLYFFVPLMAYYYENYSIAAAWYPRYTQAQLYLLSETDNEKEAERLADCILKENKQATLAYDAKAMLAYMEDDYISMISYKKQAIRTDKFSKQEYEEYAVYLLEGIEYYINAGQKKKAETCVSALKEIPDLVAQAEKTVSIFGKTIRDRVDLELNEEITNAIWYYSENFDLFYD